MNIFVTESHLKDFKKLHGKFLVKKVKRTPAEKKLNLYGKLRGAPVYIVKEIKGR